MRVLEVATDLDLDGPLASGGTAIDLADEAYDLPFKPGCTVIGMIVISAFLEAEQDGASLSLQGSDDDGVLDAYADLLLCAGSAQPMKVGAIVLPRYIRTYRASVTAGDGRGAIYLFAT